MLVILSLITYLITPKIDSFLYYLKNLPPPHRAGW
jgi:hypothetical protein